MFHHPRYVKSFVAVVGRDLPEFGGRLPEPLHALAAEVFSLPGVRVHSFGTSAATLDPPPRLSAPAWIKGRPFYAASSPGLEALGDPTGSVDGVLRNLDGKFALLMARPDGGLLCASDLLGSSRIYYHASDDGRLYLSSHLGLLLAALPSAPAYDQIGLASLLATRRFMHQGTAWEGVSVLPAGAVLTVQASGDAAPSWSIGSYGTIAEALAGPPRRGSLEALAAEYDELVRESLRRERYDGSVALMLSGGRDSPVFALSLRNEGITPSRTVTFGTPGSQDVLGATALAGRLDLPHTLVPYGLWDFSTYAERIASLNGGATSLEISYQLPGFAFASAECSTAIVGHLGNLLSGPTWNVSETFEYWWPRIIRWWGRPNPLVEQYYPAELAAVRELYRRHAEQSAGLTPRQSSLRGQAINTGWQSLNFDVAESYLEVSYPFYYRPLLSFVYNLPSEALRDNQLYDAWYRQAYERACRAVDQAAGSRSRGEPQSAAGTDLMTDQQGKGLPTVLWRRRVARSADWLFERIDRDCDDPRLRELCRASLRSHLDGDRTSVPAALMGLAPCLAKAYLWPRPSGSASVGERVRGAWKRAVSAVRQ